MFRKLPEDCNLAVFSFLAPSDILNSKFINKNTKNFASHAFLWKNLLKDDFYVSHWKEAKEPEREYKELAKQALIEKEKLATYLTAVLFSLEIDKQVKTGAIPHDRLRFDYHEHRMHKLDRKILKSEDDFLTKCKNITKKAPEIDEESIIQKIEKFMEGDQTAIPLEHCEKFRQANLLAPFKLNLPIFSQGIIAEVKKVELTQAHLGLSALLFTACKFSNIHAAKLLIESGADVNAYHIDLIWDLPAYSITTCLDIAALGISWDNLNSQKAKQLTEFLLENSADPDSKVFHSGEGEWVKDFTNEAFEKRKISIRDICIKAKADADMFALFPNTSTEILDLIINAPKLTPDEPAMKKMKI